VFAKEIQQGNARVIKLDRSRDAVDSQCHSEGHAVLRAIISKSGTRIALLVGRL
jgi:hypothetical protein